jgi:hypothetical protein
MVPTIYPVPKRVFFKFLKVEYALERKASDHILGSNNIY